MKKILTLCAFLALGSIALLTLPSCQSSNEPELHVFIWSDYIKPELIERFKREHHCQVIVDTYDSNESMYAKLNLGSGGYDVIFPSDYFMGIMIENNMLQPIDKAQLTNGGNIDPNYLKFLDEKTQNFGIPYMISIAGIGYRKDKVKNFEPSWGIFGNREYKGRMTMMNDVREVFAAALRFLGYSANTINPEEIEKATQLLITWKKNLAKFEGEQYKAGIASAEFLIVHGYNGDILQVIEENPEVAFAYPKEGTILSMDLIAIPKDAPNKELALAFINFLLEPEVSVENTLSTLFFSPNKAAYPFIPLEYRENPILFPPKEVIDNTELTRDLGDNNVLYLNAWEKVKGS